MRRIVEAIRAGMDVAAGLHSRLSSFEPIAEAAREHGVQLHVWTVNDSADMARLLSWGVDGLITDYPQRAIDTIQQQQQ